MQIIHKVVTDENCVNACFHCCFSKAKCCGILIEFLGDALCRLSEKSYWVREIKYDKIS